MIWIYMFSKFKEHYFRLISEKAVTLECLTHVTEVFFENSGGETARLSLWLWAWICGLLEYDYAGLWKYVFIVEVYFWMQYYTVFIRL